MNEALYKDSNWLTQKYIVEKLSIRQIAEKYGVGRCALRYQMKKLNIPRRTLSEARLLNFPDRSFRNRKWLYKMYRKKKFSISELGRLCKCDQRVIRDWLRKHGIESRTKQEAHRVRRKANLWRWYGSYWNRILMIGRDSIKSYRQYFHGMRVTE